MSSQRKKPTRVDPDPLVLDLLLKVGVAAMAGVLARVPIEATAAIWRRLAKKNDGTRDVLLSRLGALVDRLDDHIDEAMRLVDPSTKRSIGVALLLTGPQLEHFDTLRDAIFQDVKTVDALTRGLFTDDEELSDPGSTEPSKPFRSHLKTIEKRLRDSNTDRGNLRGSLA